MFKKNELRDKPERRESVPTISDSEEIALPAAKEEPTGNSFHARSVSYIGPDVDFTGVLSASEGLVIEGSFEGKLIQIDRSLTVGKQGRISGQVEAAEIDVRGKIDGDIYASERIRLHSGCEVTGTIYCKKISTEEGAVFNGTVDMSLEEIKPEAARLELAAGTDNPLKQKSA
jgi:cytoskeletal protein CcmA (bactofilin family)